MAACHPVPPDQRPIGGRFVAGSPILLLTTTGRRTGERRTRPLAYVRDDDRYVLCASNGGSPTHPGWYHNLAATGRAEIQVGPNHLTVGARTADPAERRRLFPPLCPDVQGLWRLRGQDQPPDPAGPADPGATEPNRVTPGQRRPLLCERKHRPSCDQRECFDSASDLGVCCRCVSAAVGWLQGVRRLFAACGGYVLG